MESKINETLCVKNVRDKSLKLFSLEIEKLLQEKTSLMTSFLISWQLNHED